jgi:hypothetical protein
MQTFHTLIPLGRALREAQCECTCPAFTRLTNAFSKKVENQACAVAHHAMDYNFIPHPPNAEKAPRQWRLALLIAYGK